MSAKVLKWVVLVDDQPHTIGGGDVLHVGQKPSEPLDHINVWTLELPATPALPRQVQVFATGEPVDVRHRPIGSVIDDRSELVWHVFELHTEVTDA